MTQAAVAQTTLEDSQAAGDALSAALMSQLDGQPPDALVIFASRRHEHSVLIDAIQRGCRPGLLVGCSSAGEFSSEALAEGSVSALALRSDTMSFSAVMARNLSGDREAAAAKLASSLHGVHDNTYLYRYALVLADALAGHTDDLIESLTQLTAGTYQFFGGGAGDDDRFERTSVFLGADEEGDAVVALEILSSKPLGIGVRHGWRPATDLMRVTEAEGTRLMSLNAVSAADVLEEHAEQTGQTFVREAPIPFFLHNVIGIKSTGGYKLRVPLATHPDGSLLCASDTPEGALASIMETDAPSAADAAAQAAVDALRGLDGARPEVAVMFDCVATRLRIGAAFGKEIESVQQVLGDTPLVGCNTYGQIARVDGQFSGFHNCTAVVCVIPQ